MHSVPWKVIQMRPDEPPEERPPDEPIRCRHCGAVDPDDHQDGCPQVLAEERGFPGPADHGETDMIIPERDQPPDGGDADDV